jgi:hypothetical protein
VARGRARGDSDAGSGPGGGDSSAGKETRARPWPVGPRGMERKGEGIPGGDSWLGRGGRNAAIGPLVGPLGLGLEF